MERTRRKFWGLVGYHYDGKYNEGEISGERKYSARLSKIEEGWNFYSPIRNKAEA